MQHNIEQLKLHLIHQIMNTQNIYFLEKLVKIFPLEKAENDMLEKLVSIMPKKLDLEEMKKEQGFTAFDKEKMYALRAEIDLKEPIEPLIEML